MLQVAVGAVERADEGSGENEAVLLFLFLLSLLFWQCRGVVGGVVLEVFVVVALVVGMGIGMETELAGEVEGGVW